jgi:hypothetical protein
MSNFKAVPAFSAKLNVPSYYATLDSIIALLRPAASLRTIGEHLNAHGFTTPRGLQWNRERVSNYIRNKSF